VNLEVRVATLDDAPVLGELTVNAYRALDKELLSDGYAGELRDVAGRVSSAEVLVAVLGRDPVGCVTYVPDHTNLYAESLVEGEAAMRMLAVDPDRQGVGAGAALVTACIDRARAAGRQRLVLHSTPLMVSAHRLYERHGFVRTPERDIQFPGLHLMAFVLDLG
jgi:ribosomal protein S18 acetylase RimI-like enzyme